MAETDDIDVWREAHRYLTLAIIVSRDNISAELTKRRFLLEEIARCKEQPTSGSASGTKAKKKAAPKKSIASIDPGKSKKGISSEAISSKAKQSPLSIDASAKARVQLHGFEGTEKSTAANATSPYDNVFSGKRAIQLGAKKPLKKKPKHSHEDMIIPKPKPKLRLSKILSTRTSESSSDDENDDDDDDDEDNVNNFGNNGAGGAQEQANANNNPYSNLGEKSYFGMGGMSSDGSDDSSEENSEVASAISPQAAAAAASAAAAWDSFSTPNPNLRSTEQQLQQYHAGFYQPPMNMTQFMTPYGGVSAGSGFYNSHYGMVSNSAYGMQQHVNLGDQISQQYHQFPNQEDSNESDEESD